MPKAGSGGPETYFSQAAPPQAVVGDYWDNGFTLRVRERTGWRLVSGPSTADTSALESSS